ncbi:MAG TPA: hypothetical protein H9863_09940 [Candidatus Odoribacter faecigallinarum]|uniref:Uncharacterized protein n=1 Tax=Candidatus Odoribacter faecigallinarum TaxID=2838706 RepID=A0A9D1V1J0_9BACT|nr:hypothetical protein [Candidatus Odoribacter faecigallinarum]
MSYSFLWHAGGTGFVALYQETEDAGAACGEAEYILAMPVKVVNTSVIRARHRARMVLEATTERGCPK